MSCNLLQTNNNKSSWSSDMNENAWTWWVLMFGLPIKRFFRKSRNYRSGESISLVSSKNHQLPNQHVLSSPFFIRLCRIAQKKTTYKSGMSFTNIFSKHFESRKFKNFVQIRVSIGLSFKSTFHALPRHIFVKYLKERKVFMFTVKLDTRCAFRNRVKRFSMLLTAHWAANVFNVNCFAIRRCSHVHINALSLTHFRTLALSIYWFAAVCCLVSACIHCSCYLVSLCLTMKPQNELFNRKFRHPTYSILTAINQIKESYSFFRPSFFKLTIKFMKIPTCMLWKLTVVWVKSAGEKF